MARSHHSQFILIISDIPCTLKCGKVVPLRSRFFTMGAHGARSKTIPRPRLWGESSRSAGTGHFGGSRTTKNVYRLYRCNIDYLINKYMYVYIYVWMVSAPSRAHTYMMKGAGRWHMSYTSIPCRFYVNTLQNTQTECVWRNTLFHPICFKARLSKCLHPPISQWVGSRQIYRKTRTSLQTMVSSRF